ncbi:MAG TPA: response regulator [Chthoniobacterales bacterium]|jgi:two-component system, OmpR family, response regulator|nr:response regulator [Chthoniobacterales bacterium]
MNCRDAQKQLTGYLILLVDDHKDFLEAIRLFLELRRASVLAATGGRDGLDLVVRHQPEIIISDLTMPRMNGDELLEQIRHLAPEQGGDAPVIALTGRSDAEERGKALEAGFARFLTKPVDLEQLVHEICSLLEPGNLAGIT